MKTMTPSTLLRSEQEITGQGIEYNRNPKDLTSLDVSFTGKDGRKSVIAHIYIVYDETGALYYSSNHQGRDLFPPTTDFSELSSQMERYAQLLQLQKERSKSKYQQATITNQSLIKNQSTMKTKNQSQEKTSQKFNQLIFIEYEKAAPNGHFITVGDSYHNTIGRIHKTFNQETGKPEFTVFDHEGKEIAKGEKLWELKKGLTDKREELLEQAHQRRIESKEREQGKEVNEKPLAQKEQVPDKKETPPEKVEEMDERERQLRDLRDDMDEDRSDIDLDR